MVAESFEVRISQYVLYDLSFMLSYNPRCLETGGVAS